MAAFRSAIAGNEELENLVQGFQLSEEERKETEILLKHLKEHFTANEEVLTERTKFAQMKQEPGRYGGLMVGVLDSGSSGPGSGPGRGHCVVFLGKTLYSHGASLHPGV